MIELGVVLPQFGPGARGPEATERIRTLAVAADRLGYGALWTADHVIFPQQIRTPYPYGGTFPYPVTDPLLDPLTTLSFVAGVTTRVKLGTSVLVLPYREPIPLAKQLATLDVMSNGRVLLGAASGWLREEFEMLGVPFAERGARTDEAIRLMRALWTEEKVSFRGRWHTLDEAAFFPKPVQPGGVPIWIGGTSPRALRRVAQLGDGWIAVPRPSLADLAQDVASIRALAEQAGRDPFKLGVSSGGMAKSIDELVERLPALERIGVTIASAPVAFWGKSFAHVLELLEELAERVGLRSSPNVA
jgi:probable F420-dependent oxidoreductase